MKLPFLCLALGSLALVGCNSAPQPTGPSKYAAGQVWSYKTRPQEPNSTFTVVKVEDTAKLGRVVHISLAGLKIKNPQAKNGLAETVAHMPYSEKAIDDSALKLVRENTKLPDYEDGYNRWKAEFDNGKAGAFTIPVSEGVGVMETALANSSQTSSDYTRQP